MKAIVNCLSINSVGKREITLRFPSSLHGVYELKFDESALGIIGLQLGDELEFVLLRRKVAEVTA